MPIVSRDKVPESIKNRVIPARELPAKVQRILALQGKYGDESTVEYNPGAANINKPGRQLGKYKYDEKELLRRASRARVGFTPEPSWNPFVHLGKQMNDLYMGGKQAVGLSSPEEYKKYMNESAIYEAANQPLVAQLGGDLLMSAPFLGINTPVKAAVGQVMKKGGLKAAGNRVLMDAAYTGSTVSPKLFPGAVGAEGGALYGVLQPVDPNLPLDEQWTQRAYQAGISGLLGLGGDIVGREVGKRIQKSVTKSLKREIQGSLPKPIDIPTPLLYGDVPGHKSLVRIASGEAKTSARESAAMQLNKYRNSLLNNFRAMNRNMSGSNNMKVGNSMRNVMNRYGQMANDSWKKVSKAYSKIDEKGNLIGDYEGYRQFANSLPGKLEDAGITVQKSVRTALNEIKRMKPIDPTDPIAFNGRKIIAKYKALNSNYATAKPRDKAGLDFLRRELVKYMDTGYFTGDTSVLDQFKIATRKAAKHYQTYRGNKIIDKYLDGTIDGVDVSGSIFGGRTLDQSTKPKADAINKILNVLPHSKRLLRNELFATLTSETGRDQAADAIPRIKQHIVSGSESGIFKNIFDEKQLKQFEDLVNAVEIGENTPDIGRSTARAVSLQDYTSKSPTGFIPKLSDLAKVRRAQEGLISPSGVLGAGMSIPPVMESARNTKEKRLYKSLLDY